MAYLYCSFIVLPSDVSLWLHQAVRGVRDREGQAVVGAHLALLFSRICKLLYYNIRPVFIFDGGTPALKQQTLVRGESFESSPFCSISPSIHPSLSFLPSILLINPLDLFSLPPSPLPI